PSGGEVTVDMTTEQRRGHRVSGLVFDSVTGTHPANLTLYFNRPLPSGGTDGSNSIRPKFDPNSGAFEVENVAPGWYLLEARTQIIDATAKAAGEYAWAVFPSASVPI